MKNKHLYSVLLLVIALYFIGFIQSCCEAKWWINSIEIHATEDSIDSNGEVISLPIETIRKPFNIVIEAVYQDIGSAFSVISTCYATSCASDVLNHMDEGSLKIAVDQSFKFNDSTIIEGSNLLEISDSGIEKSFERNDNFPRHEGEIRFTEAFLNQSVLENGLIVFTVYGKADDNTPFLAEIDLTVDL